MKQYYLKKRTKDPQDFSHYKVFGAVALPDLPDEYFSAHPLEIKNQDINYNSDFCPAYASSSVAEDQSGTTFVPEYTFAKAVGIAMKKKGPEALYDWGLELREICLAAVKFGFLSREWDPYRCDTDERPERNFIADPKNWPEDLDMLAWEFAPNSFWDVDGPYDIFDNFRNVMYQNRSEQRSIITGVGWRQSWSGLKDGMIPETIDSNEGSMGHAIKIFGWIKLPDGSTRLVAQLSDGPEVGDKGIYYFPRSIVNSEFQYGGYTFKHISKEKAQYHNDLAMPLDASAWTRIKKLLIFLIKRIFNKQ